MAEAILFGIAEEVLKNLGSRALTEVALAWGFKDRLDKLKNTIITIKTAFLNAEQKQADSYAKQADSDAIRYLLERLANVVYAADDLFDEVATVASQKQLRGGNKVIKEMHTFFSSSNQIVFAFSISRKIKSIREKLDDIVKDNSEFTKLAADLHLEGSGLNNVRRRDQTTSYIDSDEVVGREVDKKAILDLLLPSCETEDELRIIPIVGIGGQGKTTLAQLTYNDPQVVAYFDLRLWVCVSDVFDIKGITEKVLKSATNAEVPGLEMDQLQGRLRNEVSDKRYLLILDDVWNDNREEWLKLEAFLKIGRKGSKILVTTRSREVANIMGTVPLYELQGLLEEKSWELFQKVAFKPGKHHENPSLMTIGKEVVKKCANVPLAIRAIGSLLYGKDESKWLSLQHKGLANIADIQDNTLEILKLSYQQLPSPLKNCFAYCALFPKDYEFNKETLIDLWMAEGFIIPRDDEGQNLEEAAEDYFHYLLQRCFFQDVVRGKWGDIVSCKMHDFIHDLALQLAGVNCQAVTKSNDNKSDKGILHLSFAYQLTSLWKIPTWMLNLNRLRTFLLPEQNKDGSPFSKSIFQKLTSSFRCLRVLDMHSIGVKSLPSSIGKLIHLRYLNLSYTPLTKLPDSITKLQNLQTLKLHNCMRLRTLPKNMRKLNNLRSLDVGEAQGIIYMPPGLGELNSLIKLPRFIVNHHDGAKLGDLRTLNSLKGDLHIEIVGILKSPLSEAIEANLEGKLWLTMLHIEMDRMSYDDNDDSSINHDEAVLEGLKPHPNLKHLEIYCYKGRKVPSWAMNDLCTNLPNLVEVELLRCGWCQQVPSFRQLPFLKSLRLESLQSVEYMETESNLEDLFSSSDSSTIEPLFFPSLEKLTLMSMTNLEGWWKVGASVNNTAKEGSNEITEHRLLSIMSFSKLSKLWIEECPKLKYLPRCPNVKDLTLVDVNDTITVSKMTAPTSVSGISGSKLKKLSISDVEDLRSLPKECLHQLSELQIQDKNLVSTDEVFTSLSSSLRTLEFFHCESLRCISQGLEHLTALEKLMVRNCEQLELSSNEQLPWTSFKSLRYLELHFNSKVSSLPSGIQHLTNLRFLKLSFLKELKELPEWISCFHFLQHLVLYECPKLISLPNSFPNLTSLNRLLIMKCKGLTERCRAPDGSEWHKIQNIPLLSVLEYVY